MAVRYHNKLFSVLCDESTEIITRRHHSCLANTARQSTKTVESVTNSATSREQRLAHRDDAGQRLAPHVISSEWGSTLFFFSL